MSKTVSTIISVILIIIDHLVNMNTYEKEKNQNADNLNNKDKIYYIGGVKKYKRGYFQWGMGVLLIQNWIFYEGYFNKGLPNGRGRMINISKKICMQFHTIAQNSQNLFKKIELI